MAKQTDKRRSVRVDFFEAMKRAFMRRGVVPSAPPGSKSKSPAPQESSSQDSAGGAEEATAPEQPQEVHERLIDITEKAQDILFKADTVFPFTLFPDTITLDREKLTVATRSFFRIAKIVSVPVSSISSAEVDVGPFFGSLHMASKFFVQNTYRVNFLWRSEAAKLQHLLQGFIIAQEKKIDVTDIDKEDLLILLDDLGQGVSE
jgi:hypothetical protein